MQELAAMQVTMLREFRLPAWRTIARKESLQSRQICEIREFLPQSKVLKNFVDTRTEMNHFQNIILTFCF